MREIENKIKQIETSLKFKANLENNHVRSSIERIFANVEELYRSIVESGEPSEIAAPLHERIEAIRSSLNAPIAEVIMPEVHRLSNSSISTTTESMLAGLDSDYNQTNVFGTYGVGKTSGGNG